MKKKIVWASQINRCMEERRKEEIQKEYMKVTSEMKEKKVIIKNLVRGVGFGAALSPRMLGCC